MKYLKFFAVPVLLTIIIVLAACTREAGAGTEIFTVHFNTMGGSEIESTQFSPGLIIAPDEPRKQDHQFYGWFTCANFLTQWVFEIDMVSSDMTLFAKWATTWGVVHPE